MDYPRIHFSGNYTLDLVVPENYGYLVQNIDEDFIRGTQNLAKLVLKEFECDYETLQFQWDKEKGLHSIYIGEARGAYIYEGKWLFKNLDESWQAFAIFNIITLYLNRLQEHKK